MYIDNTSTSPPVLVVGAVSDGVAKDVPSSSVHKVDLVLKVGNGVDGLGGRLGDNDIVELGGIGHSVCLQRDCKQEEAKDVT